MARPKKFTPRLDTMENIQATLQDAVELLASGKMATPVHRQLMENCKEARRLLESTKAPEVVQDSRMEIVWSISEENKESIMQILADCLSKQMTLYDAYQLLLKKRGDGEL